MGRAPQLLKGDAALVGELLRFAESFEREGCGRRTPDLMRRAAKRISVLSERKRFFAVAQSDAPGDSHVD